MIWVLVVYLGIGLLWTAMIYLGSSSADKDRLQMILWGLLGWPLMLLFAILAIFQMNNEG